MSAVQKRDKAIRERIERAKKLGELAEHPAVLKKTGPPLLRIDEPVGAPSSAQVQINRSLCDND